MKREIELPSEKVFRRFVLLCIAGAVLLMVSIFGRAYAGEVGRHLAPASLRALHANLNS